MKTNSIPHTACFIRIQINVSLSRQARRKDVTIFGDTEAVRAAGPPRPPEQARPCAQAAAVAALAARGSFVQVYPASLQHPGGSAHVRDRVPAIVSPLSLPRSRTQPAPRTCTTGTRTRSPRTGSQRSVSLRAPPPARLGLRATGRAACFPGTVTLTVPWQVSTRARPPVRHSKESYPDAGAPSPVALHSLPPRTETRALQTPMRASVNFPRPQVHARPQARASVRGGGAEPRTQDSTGWAGPPPRRYTPSPTGLPLTQIISMLSITMPANGAFNLVLTRKGSLTYEFSPLKTSLHLNESNSCGLELEIYFILFF